MRTRLMAMGLLALALQGCGGGDTTNAPAARAAGADPPAGFIAAATAGRAPAVLVASDGGLDAAAEGQRLSRAGIASVTVTAPRSVGALRAALARLRAREDVDPSHIGLLADGSSTALVAKLLAREPEVTAAVLADAPAAAARPLAKLRGPEMLLQRIEVPGSDAATLANEKLAAAAPAGTLLFEHRSLRDGAAAQERVDWLRKQLR